MCICDLLALLYTSGLDLTQSDDRFKTSEIALKVMDIGNE